MTQDEVCLSILLVTVAFVGLIKAARDLWFYTTESSDYKEEE